MRSSFAVLAALAAIVTTHARDDGGEAVTISSYFVPDGGA